MDASSVVAALRSGERPAIPKPTAPEVREVLGTYYQIPGRNLGGAVHIIIEDDNTEHDFATDCLDAALTGQWGSDKAEDCDVFMAWLLTQCSRTQRHKLYADHGYPSEDEVGYDALFWQAADTFMQDREICTP